MGNTRAAKANRHIEQALAAIEEIKAAYEAGDTNAVAATNAMIDIIIGLSEDQRQEAARSVVAFCADTYGEDQAAHDAFSSQNRIIGLLPLDQREEFVREVIDFCDMAYDAEDLKAGAATSYARDVVKHLSPEQRAVFRHEKFIISGLGPLCVAFTRMAGEPVLAMERNVGQLSPFRRALPSIYPDQQDPERWAIEAFCSWVECEAMARKRSPHGGYQPPRHEIG